MNRRTQISIAASVILHVLVLLIFAGVKLYEERSIEDNIPVAFLSEQKTILLRRSIPTRPMISFSESPQPQLPEQYSVRPEYRPSAEYYVIAPEREFHGVESMGQEMFRDTGIQRPSVELQKHVSSPVMAELSKETYLRGTQIPPRISDGHDLFRDIIQTQAKPGTDVVDDALQQFAEAVRREIESNKKYPILAQRNGIEGRAGVKMTILKDGRLEKVEIVEPSGYEILDKAALQSVRDAAPFPPIPEEVGQDKIKMSIHLVFKIT